MLIHMQAPLPLSTNSIICPVAVCVYNSSTAKSFIILSNRNYSKKERKPKTMAIRSISLPSKLNSIDKKIEEKLKKLRTKEELSTSGSETISIGLSGLAELYGCVNEFLALPQTQQALAYRQQERCAGGFLKEFSMLLNVFNNVKEIELQQREATRGLQSGLFMRKECSRIQRDIASYNSTRKEIIKRTKGVIMSLKQLDDGSFGSGDYQVSRVIRILRCLSVITISVCESLLLFLSKKPKCSLVSKLMNTRRDVQSENGNELSRVDVALKGMFSGDRFDDKKCQIAVKYLKELDGVMEEIENGLERVYKQLTETKSYLMNVMVSF